MSSLYNGRNGLGISADPFIDLLFNCLLGFVFLFLAALLYINPEAKLANIEKQAEFIISATWPEHLKDDVDLWVRGPDDQTVSYLEKEVGWLHLDRDDRGEINDIMVIDGVEKIYPVNQEIITVRKQHPGEYIVNLYYYHAYHGSPLPVDVRVDKVNPKFETVFHDTVYLNGVDDEQTAVRFSISAYGRAEKFNKLPVILTPYALEHSPAWAN